MKRYNPKEIEPKWQQQWAADKIYEASEDPAKPKRYVLEYFPYPSGAAMHVGHVRNYTIGDVVARHARMQGMNVLHPMGWDAFGLPAENYAIKTGISPQQAITENTGKFKQQLMTMGFSYDWSREFASSDPDYYKWTQWFFLLLHKKGLAYRKESAQWWCPVDKTILANEQVENGHCWRCGSEVEKKTLKQWFFKITDYADRLAKDLDDVDWSDGIKQMQRNWIGRSTGAEIEFVIGDATPEVKDTLKFTPRLTDMIQAGKKWSTIRLEPKKVTEGDYVKLQTRVDKDEVKSFAVARIKSIRMTKLKDIANDHPGHEKYSSDEEKLSDYRGYYGDKVTLDTEFTVYDFEKTSDIVTVYTTRPDTLFGATFMVLAPEHPLLDVIVPEAHKQQVENYREKVRNKSDIERQETNREKTGVSTGAHAINPVNGEKIPVWTADYVLSGYGTGAIMAVPAHDERDKAFAEQFGLEIRPVIDGAADDGMVYEGKLINSGKFDGMATSEAREQIVADLEKKGVGHEKVNYRMRDWLISRQRYWGAPIPMIHCPKDGIVPVPEDQLPVVLPELTKFEPSGDGRSPLANVPEFVNTTCPKCGGPAERETDTMDGFACSSWYFLRFADPRNDQKAFDADKVRFWLPVDDYIGGAEHAVMHLLYARMWTKVMQDEGLIDFGEPFKALRNQGMILAPDGQKMSKSKGNTIQPDELIDQGYGADSIRIMELFIGPWNQSANWSVEGMGGSYRFLQRIWNLVQEHLGQSVESVQTDASASPQHDELLRVIHKTVKKVSDDLSDMGFNTAIAALMELTNELYRLKSEVSIGSHVWRDCLEVVLKLLAPFAPHMTEELWHALGNKESIHLSDWPTYDEKYLVEDHVTIAVQVNGKLRGTVQAPADSDESTATELAKADAKVAAYLEGKQPVKTIYVPGKLLNFVVR